MSSWNWCAFVLILTLIPCGYVCLTSQRRMDRLVALEFAGILASIIILLMAQASAQSGLYDVALAMAIMTYGGGLVFARILERWE